MKQHHTVAGDRLTITAAAELLGRNRATIHRWLARDTEFAELLHRDPSGPFFWRHELEAWLRSRWSEGSPA